MVVIVHQAPGVTHPVELRDHLPQSFQEQLAVFLVFEDIFATVTARGDLIESVGEFYAEGAGHAGVIAGNGGATNLDLSLAFDLTPAFCASG